MPLRISAAVYTKALTLGMRPDSWLVFRRKCDELVDTTLYSYSPVFRLQDRNRAYDLSN